MYLVVWGAVNALSTLATFRAPLLSRCSPDVRQRLAILLEGPQWSLKAWIIFLLASALITVFIAGYQFHRKSIEAIAKMSDLIDEGVRLHSLASDITNDLGRDYENTVKGWLNDVDKLIRQDEFRLRLHSQYIERYYTDVQENKDTLPIWEDVNIESDFHYKYWTSLKHRIERLHEILRGLSKPHN